jgi:PPM family protein phosphatase
MRSTCRTDQGRVRENNEDYLLADEVNGIFILADGMGGGPGGEIASELAVTVAYKTIVHQMAAPGANPARLLAEALAAAHSAVAKRALHEPSLHGMGTTLEMVLVSGIEAVTCHVGDSRIYKFAAGKLHQVTTDDNYAAMLLEVGDIPAEEIPVVYKHVLTQAVGVSDELVPEFRDLEFKPGELLLVCSDGLTGAIDDTEIEALLKEKGRDFEAITGTFVAIANERGGADNVSMILIEPVPALAPGALPVVRGE